MTVLALALGVLLAEGLRLPEGAWLVLLLSLAALAPLVLLGSAGLTVEVRRATGAAVTLLLLGGLWLTVGATLYTLQAGVAAGDDVSRLLESRPRLVRLRCRVASTPSVRVLALSHGTGGLQGAEESVPRYRTTADLGARAVFSREGGDWVPVSGRLRLSVWDQVVGLLPGDEVEVTGWLSRVRGAGNPGQADFAERERRRGVRAQLSTPSAGNITVLHPAPWPFRTWAQRTRAGLTEGVLVRFGRSAPLVLSLLLGERGYLGAGTRETLVNTGTMHFLSISGLHVGIVASAVWWLLQLLAVSRRRSAVVVIVVVVLYVSLTGLRPGAVRAAVMCAVFCGGVFLRRPTDLTNSLGVAAWLILILSPAQLFEPGFQLTFAAVVGILAFFQPIRGGLLRLLLPAVPILRLTRGGRVRVLLTHWLTGLLAVGGAAWLMVAPILAHYFHLVTPYAVPLSVIIFPVVGALVLLGLLYLLVGLLVPVLAAPIALPVAALAWFQQALLEAAARLPGATVYVAAPSVLFFGCYYGFWTVVRWGWLGPRLRPRRSDGGWAPRAKVLRAVSGYRLLVAALLLSSLFVIRPVLARRGEGLTITVLDVGHGLAAVLRLPNGTTLLYDAGGGSPSYDVGANTIAPALGALGVPRIDALVLSHYHWDHISGIPALLERFPIRRCYVNRFLGEGPLGEEVLADLKQHGVPVHEIASGDRIALDQRVAIQVLNPPRGPVGELLSANEGSVALLIDCGGLRVLLLADITGAWLGRVLDEVDGPVDVVQVPHHGLPDVDLQELIRRTRPTYALISASSGPPQESARSRLEQAGIRTLLTWEHGAVTLEMEQSRIRASTHRTDWCPAATDPEEAILVPEESEERTARPGGAEPRSPLQPQGLGNRLHGLQTDLEELVQRHPQLGRGGHDLARGAPGEALLPEAVLQEREVEGGEFLLRMDERTGDDEAGERVTGVEGSLHGRFHGLLPGVRAYRPHHLGRVASLLQHLGTQLGVEFRLVGCLVVVHVVDQTGQAPERLVLTESAGQGPHHRLSRQAVLAQVPVGDVLGQQLPGSLPVHRTVSLSQSQQSNDPPAGRSPSTGRGPPPRMLRQEPAQSTTQIGRQAG